jgi:tetratricopeptide (TPR) repeat protein
VLRKEASENRSMWSIDDTQSLKPPDVNEFTSAITTIENLFFLGLKIVVILLLLIMIWKMALWTSAEDEGVVIQPFDTDGIGNGLDGKSIAQLLSCELQKIQEIDQQAETIGIPRDFQVYNENINTRIPSPISPNSRNPANAERTPETETISSLAERNQQSDFGFLFLKGESLKYTVSGMGALGFGGASLPAGNLLLFLKELVGSTPSSIEGSIQKYNSTIIIIATMEDHRSSDSGIISWDIRRKIDVDNSSLGEQIPSMIKDLSFRIALDLARRWQSEKDFPRNWRSLEYLILAQEEFLNYNRTGNSGYFNRSKDMAIMAMWADPGYDKTLGLLSKEALIYLSINNSLEAEIIFRNIKKVRPFEGAVGLGFVYSKKKRYEDAYREYEDALKINRSSKTIWLNEGNVLYDMGKLDEAIKSYDEALKLDPNYVIAWNNKGNAFKAQGKLEEAIKSYDEALKLDPNYVNAWNGKGNALLAQGKLDEAIKSYDEALKLDPNYFKAWNGKGNAFKAQGKLDEAIKSYDEALKLDPNYVNAWNGKGAAFKVQGKLDEAIRSYDEALKLDPNYSYAWNNKGNALKAQGKLDEAIKSYDEALKLDPNYFNAWNGKGAALMAQGKLDEAIKSYDEALKIYPNYVDAWNGKGAAFKAQGKLDEAIKSYDEALKLDPNYSYAWNNKGNALKAQGKLDEAIKSYDEALKLDPNYVNAWNNKGIALEAQGKLDEAIKSYDEALRLDPNYVDAWNNKDNAIKAQRRLD